MEISTQDYQDWIDLYKGLITNSSKVLVDEEKNGVCHVMMGIIIGCKYQNNLIVGRAPYGWHRYRLDTEDLFSGENRIFNFPEILTKIKTDYSGSNKGFWKLVKGIFSPLYGDNWEQFIAYTNYCKLAEEEANPSYALAISQQEDCNRIFDKEIEFANPKNIFILTGCKVKKDYNLYTEPLMKHLLGEKWKEKLIEEVQWGKDRFGNPWMSQVYKYGGINIFLSEHPAFKFKYDGNHIKVLSNLFKKYGNP